MSALLMAKEDIFGLWALGAAELTGMGWLFLKDSSSLTSSLCSGLQGDA